jgi:hypothetical protein
MKKGSRHDDRMKWATLLRQLANCIESARPADLEDLLSGNAQLQIRSDKRQESVFSPPPGDSPPTEWSRIANQLRELPSREAGKELLSEVTSSRAQVEKLARAMDLPVAKYESIDQLRDKIIEAAIGAKLVSRAIRGDIDGAEDK